MTGLQQRTRLRIYEWAWVHGWTVMSTVPGGTEVIYNIAVDRTLPVWHIRPWHGCLNGPATRWLEGREKT